MSEILTKISDFHAGNKIEGFFLIKNSLLKISSNNKKFMDFTLADKTGEVNAKLWDVNSGNEDIFTINHIVKIRGSIIEWQGNLQLRIDKIRLSEPNDNINVSEYVPCAPIEPSDMYQEIMNYAQGIKNEDIKNIVTLVLTEHKDSLIYFPAAKKNHHAIRSGLLFHELTMLRCADKLCDVYTFLNRELLYGGVMLHDMAKIYEMDSSELGIVSDYTPEGQLLGHITQGVKLIEDAAKRVNASKEISVLLEHMILSHHYEPEYGSPVKPMFAEAEMLHYLDIMDARMFDMRKINGEIEKGSFSERVWSLDSRKIYKPNI